VLEPPCFSKNTVFGVLKTQKDRYQQEDYQVITPQQTTDVKAADDATNAEQPIDEKQRSFDSSKSDLIADPRHQYPQVGLYAAL